MTHPRKGDSTWFVNQIWESLDYKPEPSHVDNFSLENEIAYSFLKPFNKKHHTIRAGQRWKEGETFSPRVWSGKPYRSKQIEFAPPVQIKKIWNIRIFISNEIFVNGNFFCSFGSERMAELANNDGLQQDDFKNWFSKLPFSGQIICWDKNINYDI